MSRCPAQDRARSDDQPQRRQALRRHRPRQQRQPRPVRPRQMRMGARLLALCHSELVAQHEDLGVLPPPLPARQPQQRHDTGDDQEDQLQPHKPKIIPRPRSPRGLNSQRPAEHLARWHRFSAPTGRQPGEEVDQVPERHGTQPRSDTDDQGYHEQPTPRPPQPPGRPVRPRHRRVQVGMSAYYRHETSALPRRGSAPTAN
jgi:hypothetical protein